MKNIVPFETSNNNKYLFIMSNKQLISINDKIYYYFLDLEKAKLEKEVVVDSINHSLNKNDHIFVNNILKNYDYLWEPYVNANTTAQEIEQEFFINPEIVFEVTEKCNLDCDYCAYGTMYNNFDKRTSKNFDKEKAKKLINYIIKNPLFKYSKEITIGFYGGEPLLDIDFIKNIVYYCKDVIKDVNIIFTMTTNGILLHKYISFIHENNFELSISIDGNKEQNNYRKYKNKKSSFSDVYNNIKLIKENYPEYFKKNITFITVLHNKNSVQDVREFLLKEFGKAPSFSELADNGILPTKKEEYIKMFKSEYEDTKMSEMFYAKLLKEEIQNTPDFTSSAFFISNLTYLKKNKIEDIFSLNEKTIYYTPTATCIPFQQKIFVTCNYKILACESIDHKYKLGEISNNRIQINFENIKKLHNNYINNIKNQCNKCYKINSCGNCVYTMKTNPSGSAICDEMMNVNEFKVFLSEEISFLESNKQALQKIIYDTEIE